MAPGDGVKFQGVGIRTPAPPPFGPEHGFVVLSSFAIISLGKRKLVALLYFNFLAVVLAPMICVSALWCPWSRLGMSVTTQGGSGRQYVTGSRRNISKCRFVLLNVYRFRET